MLRKAGLLRAIFVAVFAIYTLFPMVVGGIKGGAYWQKKELEFLKATLGSHITPFEFTNHKTKADPIRVRYMASDCGFEPCGFLLQNRTLVFGLPVSNPGYSSFLFSHSHFLFKLRGPPATFTVA